MLRKIRITLAALFLLGITLLFAGIGHQWWGWMAKLQFLPSCLALNFLVVGGILLLTLLLGRIYCSVICPMGVFQDLALSIRQRLGKKRRHTHIFSYSPEHKWLRYGVLVLFIAALAAGLQVLVALIAPYSAYGRMVRSIIEIGDGMTAWPLSLVGIITLVVITALAASHGRTWCNSICPVGTVLGAVTRFAIFRPVIDESKCVGCHSCERKCKASCINSGARTIDRSRCVSCFDCLDNCKVGAIKFSARRSAAPRTGSDNGRRQFIMTAATLTGAAAASSISAHAQKAEEAMRMDGGLADVLPKQDPERSERLVPFGAGSVKNFYSHCTACQLCVSACPNGVLKPSTDLGHLLQPQMSYTDGYCRPECTECSKVCPAGAILPVDPEEKTSIHIGIARVNLDLCVVRRDDVNCGNCARHCPVGAIRLVKDGDSGHRIPAVVEDRCIGCGACENLCPSRPISAITVDGISIHRQ